MGKKLEKCLNFLFPVNLTCNLCGREIFSGEHFCEECESNLPKNNDVICNHCGRKVLNAEEYCNSCKGRETYFEKARSVFDYKEPIKGLIYQLKYNGKRYLAQIFASRMAMLYISNYYNCDFALAVPMSEQRLKVRKYNQAQLLAESLCEKVGIPHESDLLLKVVETARQTGLSASVRRQNLKGTFKIADKSRVKGKRILLVDDVMTTGATVECISELLIKNGAKEVLVLTVASVNHDGEHF